MKFAFIEQHRRMFSIRRMCQMLGVCSSGYYASHKRIPSLRSKEDQRLLVYIRAIHRACRKTYGVRRMVHELRSQGIKVGHSRIRRLMRQAGFRVKSRCPYPKLTLLIKMLLYF